MVTCRRTDQLPISVRISSISIATPISSLSVPVTISAAIAGPVSITTIVTLGFVPIVWVVGLGCPVLVNWGSVGS